MYQKRSFSGQAPRSVSRGPRSNFRGRPPMRGGARGGRGNTGQYINPELFINKAVIVEEIDHFIPEHTFADFRIEEKLKINISKKGYVAPTAIQDRTIPHILNGKDVVGIANTGTGKTAAFLIPLIDKMIKDPNGSVLIIVPTRELATQINDELKGFAPGTGLFSVVCVGGTPMGPQLKDLKYKNHFIIGTPGRLKDLIERRALDLSRTTNVVLDEADRMLDMGFMPDMKFIMGQMPKVRHTLFFSATMSKEIERLIHEFLHEPVSISVKTSDTSKNVDQDIVRMRPGEDKILALENILKHEESNKVIIFGRTKHGVERLAKTLAAKGFAADSIHGDKSQGQRQRALDAFKQNRISILVATDVAARGLDIPLVSHVINYDLPATYEDYIHRIGRTGRAGQTGKALTFVE
ncbi:MAG: box helicase, ATP-dependent helicase RhlE [Parcubacteria group bacterium]|nr:box helicase, ATP-dependent helicase RhlE [Parcubacteria group bacterium]